jgi:hypothetical protein
MRACGQVAVPRKTQETGAFFDDEDRAIELAVGSWAAPAVNPAELTNFWAGFVPDDGQEFEQRMVRVNIKP